MHVWFQFNSNVKDIFTFVKNIPEINFGSGYYEVLRAFLIFCVFQFPEEDKYRNIIVGATSKFHLFSRDDTVTIRSKYYVYCLYHVAFRQIFCHTQFKLAFTVSQNMSLSLQLFKYYACKYHMSSLFHSNFVKDNEFSNSVKTHDDTKWYLVYTGTSRNYKLKNNKPLLSVINLLISSEQSPFASRRAFLS